MIILSEYKASLRKSAGTEYLRKMEEAARLLGIEVINYDRGNIESLQETLYNNQNLKERVKVFWLGFVPKYEEYELVYEILKKNDLELINKPSEYSKSEYFDQFYPFIKEYTIESEITTNLMEAKEAVNRLGYPVFLKGTIQSLKKYGWDNCVAYSEEELEAVFEKLNREKDFSLGKIVIRQFTKFRYNEIAGNGIPRAHEYRFFVLNQKIIDYSFYWNGTNPFKLSALDLERLKIIVLEIAKRINVPFISVDLGETLEDGWKVIEIGDGQFSDIRNISPFKMWNTILRS